MLVGELEFLNKPVVAFVRLLPAVLLSGVAEVPIATRFLFILLGPPGRGAQYHEIGRSIATLMTDDVRKLHCTCSHALFSVFSVVNVNQMPTLQDFVQALCINSQFSRTQQSDGTFLSMKRSTELLCH